MKYWDMEHKPLKKRECTLHLRVSYHYNDMESPHLVSQGIQQEHIYFVIPCVKNVNSHICDEIRPRLINIISHNVLNNRLFQKTRSSGGPN